MLIKVIVPVIFALIFHFGRSQKTASAPPNAEHHSLNSGDTTQNPHVSVTSLNASTTTVGKGDSMEILLTAVGTSECFRECTRAFGDASGGFFTYNHSVKHVENMCAAYKEAEKCIKKNNCDGIELFQSASKGFEFLCVHHYLTIQLMKPCLETHADKVLKTCDKSCGFANVLKNLLNDPIVQELAEDGGNEIALLESLGPTCTSFMCFLSCVHRGLNFRCPGMGYIFVDTALKPIEDLVKGGRDNGLLTLVMGHVPRECRYFTIPTKLHSLKFFGINPSPVKTPV